MKIKRSKFQEIQKLKIPEIKSNKVVNSKKSKIKCQRSEEFQKSSIVVSMIVILDYVCLGCSTKNTLRIRRFSADGFGGLHKMSIVRKKWASVYEDCEYLKYGGYFRKILDTNACVEVLA